MVNWLLNWLLLGLFDDDEDDSDYSYKAYETEMAERAERKSIRSEKPVYMSQKVGLLLLLMWAILGAVVVSEIVAVWIYPNTGNLQLIGVEAYWDAEFTTIVTDIDWGVLQPGEIKQFYFYVVNNGNTNITITIATSTWAPTELQPYLTFVTQYNPQRIIEPDTSYFIGVQLTVELDVVSDYGDEFSFLTHIEAQPVTTP